MPTIRLATQDDMRVQTSRTPLEELWRLPWLYVPTDDDEVMRGWGVASQSSIADYVRLYPGALVAPKYQGERVDRGELLFYGAEPAADFLPL